MNPEPNGPTPSDANPAPAPAPPSATPPAPAVPPRAPAPPRRADGRSSPTFGCLFAVSVLLNVGAALVLILVCCVGVFNWQLGNPAAEVPLVEKVISGNASAKDKIAVVQLDGVIMEGFLGYLHRQIEQAAKDKQVKAVVLRINSPGGTITASEDLHRRLTELTEGNKTRKYDKKPLVVSMASMAASGGYYVAMPGQTIFAEKTTMTGSIGVYGSFLDVHELTDKYGIQMNVIKAGDIKDSGNPFKKMSDEEKQVWQDMIDVAYNQFLDVVVKGRKGKLTEADLLEKFEVEPVKIGGKTRKGAVPYKRNLADGGVWTAEKAQELKLIDRVGTLEDAITEAHDLASLGAEFKAVQYEKPITLRSLLGVQAEKPASLNSPLLDPARLRNGLTPRLWYLAPGCELAGMLAAVEAEQ
jgi:protease-4